MHLLAICYYREIQIGNSCQAVIASVVKLSCILQDSIRVDAKRTADRPKRLAPLCETFEILIKLKLK